MLRKELGEEVAAGLLPPAHLPHLCSYLGRIRRGWLPQGMDLQAYVASATRLAFREHQARLKGDDVLQEEIEKHRQEIRRLLATVGYGRTTEV